MENDFNPDDCDVRLVSDPSQGSDIERSTRAQAILQEAKEDQGGILNKREAYINWMKSMNEPNIEELAPEPDPNAVDPTQQLILAQQAMDAEQKQNDQQLRAEEQVIKREKMQMERQKMAMDAIAEQRKLNLRKKVK